jgi:K+-transporting ATPase ATPase C chain
VARARQLSAAAVEELISRHQQGPMLGIFGDARVNVLALNMALDRLY